MPARVFKHGVPPQRIRTFLILFAVALAAPLVGLAVYSLNRMATLEQAEIERRVLQVAEDLAHDIDRELDRATAILDTLASSSVLRRGDLPAFRLQTQAALKHTNAAIVLIDRTYQQLTSTMAEFGAPLPKTADAETARRVFETKQRQVSDLFRGSMDGRPVFNVEVPTNFTEDKWIQSIEIKPGAREVVHHVIVFARVPAAPAAAPATPPAPRPVSG